MSIVELSQEIDKLAKVIIQKNLELENLKKGYDERLRVINDFIAKVHPGQVNERISSETFTQQISKSITCPNCNHVVYNNSQEEFVLLPNKQIEYLSSEGGVVKPQVTTPQPMKLSTQNSKRKSHITCSYCKKQGHTRANCKKRLGWTD
ncbi:hypothetical protein CORT_0D02120 [Candida orthopsilosis Co 90-125]|uniref:CCHC-type domain-containing protein n=1 Tax=Candida orthopsilosis (strain 90-125) TaxID=1136231 RepID=H8X4W7_CANO9|nr:hypothetical protein CORT_0D02120 [Candida orthopsilosis Co 90-125]CCG23060.1 hypothetical protein CORT_0D02120 [Candida orthopsilosis Co 90-125]